MQDNIPINYENYNEAKRIKHSESTSITKQKDAITVYTTQRCITVEEDYEAIIKVLLFPKCKFLELTEVITYYSDFPQTEPTIVKRKVFIQKQHIIEVIGQDCS